MCSKKYLDNSGKIRLNKFHKMIDATAILDVVKNRKKIEELNKSDKRPLFPVKKKKLK